MAVFSVPRELDGERADKVVAVLGRTGRAEARKLVGAGAVTVGGRTVAAGHRLTVGEEIVFEPPPPTQGLVAEPVAFKVRFEDEVVIVVDKPAGVTVHPGAGQSSGTLAAGLLNLFPELEGVGDPGRWGIVHRLDRDTSGLLLVARNQHVHAKLREDLAERRIGRQYLALAEGRLAAPRGTIDAPIGADPSNHTRRMVTNTGRPARTHYRVSRSWAEPAVALLEVTLETGRTHQIRVHLASIGHPVIGDRVYGRLGSVRSSRPFLHAARLEFSHPVTGRLEVVSSPLPSELQRVLGELDGNGNGNGIGIGN